MTALAGLMLALASWILGQAFSARTASGSETADGDSFWALLFGFLTLISLFALWTTGGKSIFVFCLPLLGCFLDSPSKSKIRRELPGFARFLVWLAFWLGLCWLFYGGPSRTHEAHADLGFYAQAVEGMTRFGVENPMGARPQFSSVLALPSPYHYGDLWGAALLHQMFGLRGLPAMMVLQPFLLALACHGFRALTGSWGGALVLPLAAGVVAPARLFVDSWLFGYALPWLMYPHHLLNRPKIALTMAVYLAALLLLRQGGRPLLALLCALLAVPLSPTMWPAGLSGVCLAALLWQRRGLLSRRELATIWLAAPALAAGLILFYRQLGAGDLVSTPPLLFSTALLGLLKAVTYIAPNLLLLALILVGRRQALRAIPEPGIGLGLCLWAGAGLGLALFQASPDGFQVLTEPFYATFAIPMSLAAVSLLQTSGGRPRWQVAARVLLLGWLAFSWSTHFLPFYRAGERAWSPGFETSVLKAMPESSPVVVQLCSPRAIEEFTEPRLRGGLAAHGLGIALLWHSDPAADLINLSDPYLELSADPQVRSFQRAGLSRQLLSVYARERDIELNLAAIESFLREFRLRYVILDRHHRVPDWLRPYVEEELFDARSGERFLRLKPW